MSLAAKIADKGTQHDGYMKPSLLLVRQQYQLMDYPQQD
jgi:hypothetical protein